MQVDKRNTESDLVVGNPKNFDNARKFLDGSSRFDTILRSAKSVLALIT